MLADRTKINDTIEYLEERLPSPAEIGLILGSGLGALADQLEDSLAISYKDIPHFPESTVQGHAGQLVHGNLEGKKVIIMQGRFHFYEGYSMDQVTYPVRVMQKLGAKSLVVTNAAGGINRSFNPGDLMLIEDHLNLMGTNPLIGPNEDSFGPRFPDMSEAYNKELRALAEKVAAREGFSLQKGVYVGLTGPTYETPAEIRYLGKVGADAVGMSTVPEVIVANHGGMRVLGISCISNMAAGILDRKLDHQEVMDTAERIKDKFLALVRGVVRDI